MLGFDPWVWALQYGAGGRGSGGGLGVVGPAGLMVATTRTRRAAPSLV